MLTRRSGNNHLPWARITKPYVQAYKNGAPVALGSDLIIWEYRTHPANATATVDAVGPPQGSNLVHDNIYITAYLSAPAEVRVTVGSRSGSFQVRVVSHRP
jgi:glucan endo-1,3-alpha-glucosidase